MKTLKLLICLGLLTTALASCYKDLGNDVYHEINELEIKGLMSRYEKDQDDSLKIPIDLSGTQYSDTTKFTFAWEIAQKIVSTHKDLKIKVNMSIGEQLGRLIITDKTNSAKSYFRFSLRVSSSTAGDLIVVLSKYNGEAELSYKRLDKDGEFVVNYYKSRFGVPLGTGPKSIHVNYNHWSTQVPFSDVATLGGLQVLSEEGLKILDKNTMGPKTNLDYITGATFAAALPPYPIQDVSNFKPELVSYQVSTWSHNPYGGINQSGNLVLISNGGLYFIQIEKSGSRFYVNQKPTGGYLAPAYCYASLTNHIQAANTPLKMRGYNVSSYMLMYDDLNGKFLYSNFGSYPGKILDTDKKEYMPSYPGYKMIHATHTSNPNKCIAVLHNGIQTKLVYLTVPNNGTELKNMPFAVNGTVDVSKEVIRADSKFYTMKYSPYLIFSSGNKLYRYNALNVLNNSAPTEVIADLRTMGYDADASISSFTVSRTEKTLIMAVSRYHNDAELNSTAVMGDVVMMNLNNASISLEFNKKYEGVSGKAADIKIKYQTHQRDGVNMDGLYVDKI